MDHVHAQNQMGVGKARALSDPDHLVSVCQGHMEDGRKAGFQWNTANRAAERAYLTDGVVAARAVQLVRA